MLYSALRNLVRSPGFSALSVLTLAVGIAATTAIFSVVDAVLIRPLPYPESQRLVAPVHDAPGLDLVGFGHADGTYRLYRRHNRVFDELAVFAESATTFSGEGDPERLDSLVVTPSIFPVLGLTPAVGRMFREDDGLPATPSVVMLSDALWRRSFGAEPEVLGRRLTLNGAPREVVGVLPPGLAFPRRGIDIWQAKKVDPAGTTLGVFANQAVARLAEGVTVEAAEADLNRLVSDIEAAFPDERGAKVLAKAGVALRTPRLRDVVVGEVETVLRILLAGMAVVLAIACVNVGNLFLVRAEGRRKETALRTALGGTRGTLVRKALAESACVAALASLLGLAGAWGAVRLLVLFGPADIPRLHEVGVDGRGLAFTAVVALAVAVVFAVVPLFAARRRDLVAALAEGAGRGATAGRRRYLARQLLVAGQVALALVLSIVAGLLLRSFQNLARLDPGFNPRGVMSARLALPGPEYREDVAAAAFFDRLLEKLASLPGVESAAGIKALPIAGSLFSQGHVLEDFPVDANSVAPVFQRDIVTPGYFETMRIPLVEGRFLDRGDHQNRTGAVLVSESLARHYWGTQSAVGKRLAPARAPDDESGWYTIVGVAGDVRAVSLREAPPEIVYYPMLGKNVGDWRPSVMTLVLRAAAAAPETLVGPLRAEVRGLDPNLPVFNLRTLDDVMHEARAPVAFTVVLILIAAVVALVLGAVGTFATVSYVVGRRRAEIGVRMALGARRRDVLGMVLRQGLALGGVGAVVGLIGAFMSTRWLESTLFEISPLDPVTFAAAALALLAVALLASFLPARRASRIDPTLALRFE